jgi:hypothetical protein
MAIIVSKNGQNAVKLSRTEYGLENMLQEYIHDNPESIPLYDIKEDVKLLILAREFMTSSGPIDAIGVDQDGELYLVETKLYKNPDKRTVVAQVLDYGASLWKTHPDFDSFLVKINSSVQDRFHQTVRERIISFFSFEEDQVDILLNNLRDNLNNGNFKFVVLMDTIHDQLKDLILYMNQNSKFDIYGVELEYYKHGEFEITIPKLFGAEVKKDIIPKRSTTTHISDDEFISVYASIGLENNIEDVLSFQRLIESGEIHFKNWSTKRTPKNINFNYINPDNNQKVLDISLGYNLNDPSPFGFWLHAVGRENEIIAAITSALGIACQSLPTNAKYGIIARWDVKDFTKEKMNQLMSLLH